MLNLAIFCGGMSAEHEISIISSINVLNAIDKTKYNPFIILISRSGTWYFIDNIEKLTKITKCDDVFEDGILCSLMINMNKTYLTTIDNNQIVVDCAFPILHGPMGEDGTIQGLFEIFNLPYVGSGVLSSSISMDKEFFKKILYSENFPIIPYFAFSNHDKYIDYELAITKLGFKTLFVKPANMGSSVGVSKVRNKEEYDIAVKFAFKYSAKVIVEKSVKIRELECSILGNEDPKASVIGEIKPAHEFYSYEAKYTDPSGAELVIPAILSDDLANKIKDIAIRAYKAVNCLGFARVDFFMNEENEIFVNEINTIPGFTSISMYPKLWEYSGINYSDLISRLIELAIKSYKEKKSLYSSYSKQ